MDDSGKQWEVYLHFTVDNSSILTLTIDVVNLSDVVLLPEDGVENMVQVYREDVKEPTWPRSIHGVACVVCVCPCICPDDEIFLFTASTIFCDKHLSARALLARRSKTSL